MLAQIKENYNLFTKELGENVPEEKIVDMICDSQSLEKILWKSHRLLGTILGYGPDNATDYEV